jgi:transcriptional regulator with XRE-family HTH domain
VTQTRPAQGPITAAVAREIQGLRKRRNLSARKLAELCAEAGAPGLNRSVIANIEAGRRPSISIDELFVLAQVLDVSVIWLLRVQGVPPLVQRFGELRQLAQELLFLEREQEIHPEHPTERLIVEGTGDRVLTTEFQSFGPPTGEDRE